jgi:hypothetical protein
MQRIAPQLAASVKAMVPGRFEVVKATPKTHPQVNWDAYRAARKRIAALGFRHLGDVDPVSVWMDPSMFHRTVLSIYASKDGTEIVAHYRLTPRWTLKGFLSRFMGATRDYFDVGTNFGGGDGVSVETTNAALSAVWKSPDFIIRDAQPSATSLGELLTRHRDRISRYRAAHPDAVPTIVKELNDTIGIADTMERRKLEWRKAFGWATKDEIAAVTKLKGPMLDEVFEEFKKKVGADSRVAPLSGTLEEPPAAAAAPAALQFDRVETGAAPEAAAQTATLPCATCGTPITEYFDVDGRGVCESCKDAAARENEPARGVGLYFKALVYGGVATVIGAAIYYAVIAITEFEIGLVALLIGFMVGAAVRVATAGRGGRRFQLMAVVLTYFAVGLAYTPLAVKGALDSSKSDSAQADSVTASIADSLGVLAEIPALTIPQAARDDSANVTLAGDTGAAADEVLDSAMAAVDSAATDMTVGSAFLGLGVVLLGGFLMAFALPIFAILSTMPSGLISALIIGIGMHQAWKMTAAQVHRISGPYQVGSKPESAT